MGRQIPAKQTGHRLERLHELGACGAPDLRAPVSMLGWICFSSQWLVCLRWSLKETVENGSDWNGAEEVASATPPRVYDMTQAPFWAPFSV